MPNFSPYTRYFCYGMILKGHAYRMYLLSWPIKKPEHSLTKGGTTSHDHSKSIRVLTKNVNSLSKTNPPQTPPSYKIDVSHYSNMILPPLRPKILSHSTARNSFPLPFNFVHLSSALFTEGGIEIWQIFSRIIFSISCTYIYCIYIVNIFLKHLDQALSKYGKG